ncbi:MAG: hypothetical protein ACRD68_16140 [Pyrinomonadaceae bacterium]
MVERRGADALVSRRANHDENIADRRAGFGHGEKSIIRYRVSNVLSEILS